MQCARERARDCVRAPSPSLRCSAESFEQMDSRKGKANNGADQQDGIGHDQGDDVTDPTSESGKHGADVSQIGGQSGSSFSRQKTFLQINSISRHQGAVDTYKRDLTALKRKQRMTAPKR